jgi:hypothetical protein
MEAALQAEVAQQAEVALQVEVALQAGAALQEGVEVLVVELQAVLQKSLTLTNVFNLAPQLTA